MLERCRGVLLACPVLLLGACAPGQGGNGVGAFFARLFHHATPPKPPEIHYVLGPGYSAGGVWYYPQESFSYDTTGIAGIVATPAGMPTEDGEVFDPQAMTAAHQTLQLPAVVLVTNLDNGRQLRLRVNDRGPDSPARVIAVSPHAAELLGFAPDGTAEVRVQIDAAASQALSHQFNGAASQLAVASAPLGAVQAAALPPPPGARGSAGLPVRTTDAATAEAPADEAVPLQLPQTVTQVPPNPGTLWIEAGSFGRAEYAERRAAQLADTGARAGRLRVDGETRYTVRIGPVESVSRADSLMRQVIRDGVTDARVVVE